MLYTFLSEWIFLEWEGGEGENGVKEETLLCLSYFAIRQVCAYVCTATHTHTLTNHNGMSIQKNISLVSIFFKKMFK